jgi:hypothetical protein
MTRNHDLWRMRAAGWRGMLLIPILAAFPPLTAQASSLYAGQIRDTSKKER